MQLFLATRYPDRGFWTVNNGLSGDSAAGALRRYDFDIAPKKVTAAFIHFGMNDVGRDGFKGRMEPFPEVEREPRRAKYADALRALGDRLAADGARGVAILSPTIFDDVVDRWNNAGERPQLNAELARYGIVGAGVARERGWPAVDLHAPLGRANVAALAIDPTRGLTRDRVHPNTRGHQIMAAEIANALADRREVCHVHLDAAAGVSRELRGAALRELSREPDGLVFSLEETALPFPDEALALGGFPGLNRQLLRVERLDAGNWTLAIDGADVLVLPAADWAAGVDLGTVTNTPQYRLAAELRTLVLERKLELEKDVRIMFSLERCLVNARTKVPDWNDHMAVVAAAKARVQQLTDEGNPPQRWGSHVYSAGIRAWTRRPEILSELEAVRARVARPVPSHTHRYVLRKHRPDSAGTRTTGES